MEKILVIEDNPIIMKLLESLLVSENYNVVKSTDGRQGITLSRETSPDLVLLDLNLPDLSGFEVCRQLRKDKYEKPIIMLTAHSEQANKVMGLEFGADDYITKPFDNLELIARVRSFLRRSDRLTKRRLPLKKPESHRRLVTLMFTDMQNYSGIMNKDEKTAIHLLELHNSLINEVLVYFDSKVIEIIGDAYVISFASVVDAVECAVEIQRNFKIYNDEKPDDKKILVRIGIHLGDVIESGRTLKGDTVNIAARIQQSGSVGNIMFSEIVYLAVKNKVDYPIINAGEFDLKNISEPMTLYRIDI
jgi:CheY-like chemotaxis protein